jgi:hypothetical protein
VLFVDQDADVQQHAPVGYRYCPAVSTDMLKSKTM